VTTVNNFFKVKNLKTILFFLIILSAFNFQAQSKKTSFIVNGMCGMCKERIESTLDVKGVTFASWSEETHICNVTFNSNKISEKEIHQLLAAKGHDTPICRASDEAYNNLHHCCHYVRKDSL
jgi:copper chaperone CopZ